MKLNRKPNVVKLNFYMKNKNKFRIISNRGNDKLEIINKNYRRDQPTPIRRGMARQRPMRKTTINIRKQRLLNLAKARAKLRQNKRRRRR